MKFWNNCNEQLTHNEAYFNREEAQAKIGKLVEASIEFPSVPKGTKGIVIKANYLGSNRWTVRVEWRLPETLAYKELSFGRLNLILLPKDRVTMELSKSQYARSVTTPVKGWDDMPARGYRKYLNIAVAGGTIALFGLLFVAGRPDYPSLIGLLIFLTGMLIALTYAVKYTKSKRLPK